MWRAFGRAAKKAQGSSATELVGILGGEATHGFYRLYVRPLLTNRWFRIERKLDRTETRIVNRERKGDFAGARPREHVYVGRIAAMHREPRTGNTHLHHAICLALDIIEHAHAPSMLEMAASLGELRRCTHSGSERRVRGLDFESISDDAAIRWLRSL